MAFIYAICFIKMIRILFTIPNFDSAGSGKALLHVAKRMDTSQFEVHIACFHNRGSFFKEVEKSGIPVHVFNTTTKIKPYFKGLKACYHISKKFKAINPDIIHSFHYAGDYTEALAAKMAGIKWVYTKKNMNWGGGSKNGWYLRTYLASAIAVQNTDMMSDFFSNSQKTTLIPRGVDVDMFRPIKKDEHLIQKWGLHSNHRIIMCVANLVPVKGIEVLLEAFNKIADQYSDWKLMIVGDNDNPYGKKMLELTAELGIKEKVVFCGKQTNIQNYLSIAEVVVLPTLNKGRKEGSPVALLEAMASGKTVLGSNISGIKDQLQAFPKHLVTAGNVEDWATALQECCSNSKEKNETLGMAFRTHVIKNYHIDLEVNRCQELCFKLINKS